MTTKRTILAAGGVLLAAATTILAARLPPMSPPPKHDPCQFSPRACPKPTPVVPKTGGTGTNSPHP